MKSRNEAGSGSPRPVARRKVVLLASGAIVLLSGAGWGATQVRAAIAHPAGSVAGMPATLDTAAPDTLVALGEKVFKGRAGGAICTTCHGTNAKGMKGLGPDLTDATWLNGDGSRASIKSIIRSGVPKPKQASAPMPPYGGTPLNAAHLEAVTAYVYSLSH